MNGTMELYRQLAKRVNKTCAEALESEPVSKSRIEHRAKEPASLVKKLLKYFGEGKSFESADDVEQSTMDLAGVRISMDNQGDLKHVYAMIRRRFIVVKDYDHPKPNEKPKECGFVYRAHHFYVRLNPDDPRAKGFEYATQKVIEIQVMAETMRIAAVLEHQTEYKAKRKPNLGQRHHNEIACQAANLLSRLVEQGSEREAQRDAKDNMPLGNLDNVGTRVGKWIESCGDVWFKHKPRRSSKPLFMYLGPEGKRAELDRLLEEHLQSELELAYKIAACNYGSADLDLIVYIMDRIFLECDDGNAAVVRKSHLEKIHIMISTFIWLSKLFEGRLSWQLSRQGIFTGDDDESSLDQALVSLQRSKRYLGRESPPFDLADIDKLEWLWGWFERQQARKIRLAFAMSNEGMTRCVTELGNEIKDTIDALRLPSHPRGD